MYCLASLPSLYVYSFVPKSDLIGFVNYFVINLVACVLDMVLAFMAVFSQSQSTNGSQLTGMSSTTNRIRWAVVLLFPSVNLKHALFNMRLQSSDECISALNALMLTEYSSAEPPASVREPGIGRQLIIFCAQMSAWWLMLVVVEHRTAIRSACHRRLRRIQREHPSTDSNETRSTQWSDAVCSPVPSVELSESPCSDCFRSISTPMFDVNVDRSWKSLFRRRPSFSCVTSSKNSRRESKSPCAAASAQLSIISISASANDRASVYSVRNGQAIRRAHGPVMFQAPTVPVKQPPSGC